MDECEALRRKARGAVEDAVNKHGSDRKKLLKALEEAANEDPELRKGFVDMGFLDHEAEQSTKH